MKKTSLTFLLTITCTITAMDDSHMADSNPNALEARLAALAVNPTAQQPPQARPPDPLDALLDEFLAENAAASAQLTQRSVDDEAADNDELELALAIAIVEEENRQRSKRIRQRSIPRKYRTNGWCELLNLPLVRLIPLTTDPEEQEALALALGALKLGKKKDTKKLAEDLTRLRINSGVGKKRR